AGRGTFAAVTVAAFWTPVDRAEVTLVEPCPTLLGEDARDTFAVQVGPLVASTQAHGQVLQAGRVHFFHRRLHDRPGVLELARGQTALQVRVALPHVAGLGHRRQAGVHRVERGGRGLLVQVSEVGRAH